MKHDSWSQIPCLKSETWGTQSAYCIGTNLAAQLGGW